jgi:hypothetical protein
MCSHGAVAVPQITRAEEARTTSWLNVMSKVVVGSDLILYRIFYNIGSKLTQ